MWSVTGLQISRWQTIPSAYKQQIAMVDAIRARQMITFLHYLAWSFFEDCLRLNL